ncbi:MAG TPA: hypothetical protein VLU96_06870 [Gaiellaceae bacterium]|nr:hypothetical protein [Gaiellaceae bacterium]
MTETEKLETLLASGGDVRLARHDAQEVLQKLRVRGGGGESADRLESQLADNDEVVLPRDEARELLEELRASGRRWVFGSEAPREPLVPTAEHEPEPAPEPEPELEPAPEPESRWRRFWLGR